MSTSTWANIDRHVDETIDASGSEFINSSRVLIYAKPTNRNVAPRAVGVIQGWSFAEQRQMDELFEIGSDLKYIIPGRTNGQINIQRVLISGVDLANTLHQSKSGEVIRSLKDIAEPVDLIFVAYENVRAGNEIAAEKFQRYFEGCWITARQESMGANQAIVAESCSISYKNVRSTTIEFG